MAAYALGEIGDKKAISGLKYILKHSCRSYIKLEAIIALGKLGDRAAIDTLIGFLNRSVHTSSAAEALGNLKALKAVPLLIKQLRFDRDDLARDRAA